MIMFRLKPILLIAGISTLFMQSAIAVPEPIITTCSSNPKLIKVKYQHAPFVTEWRTCSTNFNDDVNFKTCVVLPKTRFAPCVKKIKKQRIIMPFPHPMPNTN